MYLMLDSNVHTANGLHVTTIRGVSLRIGLAFLKHKVKHFGGVGVE